MQVLILQTFLKVIHIFITTCNTQQSWQLAIYQRIPDRTAKRLEEGLRATFSTMIIPYFLELFVKDWDLLKE